jgi:hypothetical protein
MVPPKRRNQPRSSTNQASTRPDNPPPERASPHHDPAFSTPKSSTPPTSAAAAPSAAPLTSGFDLFEPDPDFDFDSDDPFSPGQLSAYLPSPGGPLIADGDTTLDFSRFGTFYEPQGELATLAHALSVSAPDFDLPIPISGAIFTVPPLPGIFPTIANPTAIPLLPATPAHPSPGPDSGTAVGNAGAPAATSRGPMTSRAGLKRKAGAASLALPGAPDDGSTTSAAKRPSLGAAADAAARAESSRLATMRNPPSAAQSPATMPEEQSSGTASARMAAAAAARAGDVVARLNPVLPAGKLFPIRIGSELFQLSGASISSDGKIALLLDYGN